MKPLVRLIACVTCLVVNNADAQLRAPRTADEATLPAATVLAAEPASRQAVADGDFNLIPANLGARNALLIGTGVLLVGAYGMAKWWDDGFTGKFRSENEGWFGQNTYAGGADKLGHAMFAYAGTRVLSRGFEWIGNSPEQARKLAFWSSVGVMTAVEITDGFSRQYKFSAQDAVMNVIGAGLAYLMERDPQLDALVDFRLHYKKSKDSSFDPASDYSGQTYLLTVKASGIPALRAHEPLRYFELAFGYGTRGYESADNPDRSRNLYVGISLNVSEVLRRTVYRGNTAPSFAQRGTELFFEHIQIPGTVGLSHHRL